MHIITLTTDWNSDDFYVGLFKGKLLSRYTDLNIIDITHKVRSFNTAQAAFIVRNAYHHFPPGTIHVIFVNAEPSKNTPFLIIKANGHYFIGTDNGIFDLILMEDPEIIVNISGDFKESEMHSFSAFEIFAQTACDLSAGKNPESLGRVINSYNRRTPFRATIEDKVITGKVIYIDSYMNAITNITRELFDRVGVNRSFEIFVQGKHNRISSINQFYHQSPAGELLAIFNSAGLLEIAINSGNVARLLNLDTNSVIRVEFKD